MRKNKHLSIEERTTIMYMLNQGASFKEIGRSLGRDCTTISKEVRNHIVFKKSGFIGHPFNDCRNRIGCLYSKLCNNPDCRHKRCCNCPNCRHFCSHYQKELCSRLNHPPYVCNGCSKKNRCSLEKHLYSASAAQAEYETLRSEARSGIAVSEQELSQLDHLISPLLRKGQSIHHICVTQTDAVMFSEKTIYNYVEAGLFSARNLDLPRKVSFKQRKSNHDTFKVEKNCRIGRSYSDFLLFLQDFPDCPIVQMDSVVGSVAGKVLLTIHFSKAEFMLAFLRDRNTAASVSEIFDRLYQILRPDRFQKLFPVILTDNGSEFSNPSALEMDTEGNPRTKIFYCDPSSPYQKGAIENNHEFIRRILPKGSNFDHLTQEKIDLMMNHINSYHRANLGDRCPYEMFQLLYGQELLDALGAVLISPNDITLRPELLK